MAQRRGVNLFKDSGILNREQLQKLVKNLRADVKSLIPCHFLVEDNEITAFGHGQCFRIPYKDAIGNLVSAAVDRQQIREQIKFVSPVQELIPFTVL